MTGADLKHDVVQWIEENRHLERHPLAWRLRVAERLADHEDMARAWHELARHRVPDGRHVMSLTFQSFEDAHRECRRLPSTDEAERIDAVVKAVRQLRDAIARAPFLDNAHFIDMDGTHAVLAWRASGAPVAEMHRAVAVPLCLDSLLEYAENEIPAIAARQPGRTIGKQRDDPELLSFVRHLAAHFQHRYASKMMGTIARIANTLYNPAEPVTKQRVEKALRHPSQ
ncbi:MAG: hypothetical protein ACOY5S_04605 [Pseudomonadota bacterium]